MAEFKNIKTVSVPSIGKLPLAEKPGTFTPGAKKREHKAGRLAEDGGHSETSVPAKLELNLNLVPGTDVDKINAVVDEDITVRLSDGTVYLMPKAFATDAVGIGDSDSKVTFLANSSEKM